MTGIIVQARLGSNRLPRKVLLPIAGKSVIAHVMERCIQTGFPVVLAVPHGEEETFAINLAGYIPDGHHIYGGHATDVLDRYYEVAKKFKFDPIVRITGDCPLVDPNMIRAMVSKFDIGYLSNCHPIRTVPPGMDIEIFNFHFLENIWNRSRNWDELVGYSNECKEHVTKYMYENFYGECKTYSPLFPDSWKMCIDTQEDYERVKAMVEEGKFPWMNADIR